MTTNSSSTAEASRIATVVGVKESLVTIDVSQTPVMKNEVGYILVGTERLKSEVLRIQGNQADMQVFEDTRGVKVGDTVELSGEMLSVALAPGLLGSVFDGLQNPLGALAEEHGFFLPRGVDIDAVSLKKKWEFKPSVSVGQSVVPGQVLGTTQEGIHAHKIVVPFDEPAEVEVTWIRGGNRNVTAPIARIRRANGEEREVSMLQRWP